MAAPEASPFGAPTPVHFGMYWLRHYVGLGRYEARFAALLRDMRWSTMSELIGWTRARTARSS